MSVSEALADPPCSVDGSPRRILVLSVAVLAHLSSRPIEVKPTWIAAPKAVPRNRRRPGLHTPEPEREYTNGRNSKFGKQITGRESDAQAFGS